jgi:hypothetical protein
LRAVDRADGRDDQGFSHRRRGVAGSSEADAGIDPDWTRWKAIYLSALLFKFLPGDEKEKHIEGLRVKVRELRESGGLSFVGDYRRFFEPLGVDVLKSGAPAADQQGQMNTVFEVWISGFPWPQLVGAASKPSGQMRNHPSAFNPGWWFG